MTVNVHIAHIESQPHCAWGAIPRILQRGDTLCMARKQLRPTFMRQWRQYSGKTLVQVAEALGMTHGQLSRIERGLQPYNQELLERLGELYRCDFIELLVRDPSEPTSIWSAWRKAGPTQRRQIAGLAEALLKELDETEDE